jgi:hypothetical protein
LSTDCILALGLQLLLDTIHRLGHTIDAVRSLLNQVLHHGQTRITGLLQTLQHVLKRLYLGLQLDDFF